MLVVMTDWIFVLVEAWIWKYFQVNPEFPPTTIHPVKIPLSLKAQLKSHHLQKAWPPSWEVSSFNLKATC